MSFLCNYVYVFIINYHINNVEIYIWSEIHNRNIIDSFSNCSTDGYFL